MDLNDVEAAFCEELEKIGSSNMHVPNVRAGRRPISAEKLLKRDGEGTLFRGAPRPALDGESPALKQE